MKFFDKKVEKDALGIWGLVISAFGSFVSAIAVSDFKGAYVQSPETGNHYYSLIVNSNFAKFGFILLIMGFLLQIFERSILNKKKFLLGELILYIIEAGIVIYGILYICQYLIFR